MERQLHGQTFLQALGTMVSFIPEVGHDLQWCKELRKDDKHKDMQGLGRMGLHIPDPCLELLNLYHPELFTEDEELNARAWKKFMFHQDSKPFKVVRKL